MSASNAAARVALGGSPAPRRWGAVGVVGRDNAAAVADGGAADLDETPDNRWLALGLVTWLAVLGVAVLVLPGAKDAPQLLGRSLVIMGVAMVLNAGIMRRAFAPNLRARSIRLARSERTDAEVVAAATHRGITTHTVRFTDHRGIPREADAPLAGTPRVGACVAIRFDREDPSWVLDEVSATVGMRRLRAIGPSMAALGVGAALVGLLALLA